MSTFTEEKIKYILTHPSEETDGFENRYLIYRMLQALYARQTEQEKQFHGVKVLNGIGFSKWDAPFLTDVAKKSKPYKNLSWNQALAVGKSLVKYRKQLVEIAASYQVKHIEPARVPTPQVSDDVLDDTTSNESPKHDKVFGSKEYLESYMQFGEGEDNILDI